jgi:hypothetical protein
MPNWCSNNISIAGPTETIKAIWEDATSECGGLLSAMVPQPDNIFRGNLGTKEREECAEQGIPNWYDWNVSNWGTKWDVDTEGLEFTDNGDGTATIEGWFESAWAPPIEAYNTFCDDMGNCSLEASYYEPGMDFAGFYSNGDDEYCDDLHGEYKLPEDERSDLYNRLDEEWGLSEQFEQWDEDYEDEEDLVDEA